TLYIAPNATQRVVARNRALAAVFGLGLGGIVSVALLAEGLAVSRQSKRRAEQELEPAPAPGRPAARGAAGSGSLAFPAGSRRRAEAGPRPSSGPGARSSGRSAGPPEPQGATGTSVDAATSDDGVA